MESALVNLQVPKAQVKIGHLKTLHDTSYLECDSLELVLSDDFEECAIYDVLGSKFIDPISQSTMPIGKPILFVKAHSGKIDLKIMSRFEILRKQIMDKVVAKGGSSNDRSTRKTQRY